MKEHYYINKVDVLGVNVSAMKADKAVNATWALMKRQGLAKVFFLTAEGSLYCTENPEVAETINRCNLILASDEHTEKAVISDHVVSEDYDPGNYAREYLKILFDHLNRESGDVYVITETEDQLTSVVEYIGTGWDNLRIKGASVSMDNPDSFEKAINEINGIIPEYVLVCLPFTGQYDFLKGYSAMINAKLCVFVEKLQPIAERETTEVPGFYKKTGLGNFFHWIRNKRKFSDRMIGTAFLRKVNQENQTSHPQDNDISM